VLGTMAIMLFATLDIIKNTDFRGTQFKVPGQAEVTIEEAGKYYLWNDYSTFFEDKSYRKSPDLPDGATYSIANPEGETVELHLAGGQTMSAGSHQKSSIGYFNATKPGTYTVTVEGDFGERIFSVQESLLADFFLVIFGMVTGGIFALGLGAGLIVWGIFALVNSRRASKALTQAPRQR